MRRGSCDRIPLAEDAEAALLGKLLYTVQSSALALSVRRLPGPSDISCTPRSPYPLQ